MARLNRKTSPLIEETHEGAKAYGNLKPIQQLRRSVMSCFLWENEFYEDGQSIADRITSVAINCDSKDVAALAIEARTKGNLRHVPLLLLAVLARISTGTSILSQTMPKVIRRADELAEFLSIYAKYNGVRAASLKKKLSSQVKKGLAASFANFNEYGFAKYNRDGDIKLRDVMFLCHPKPADQERQALYKAIAENTLKTPDTWEVALSGGADKKEAFTRLLTENKLGAFALIRNLRNMEQADVSKALIKGRLLGTADIEQAKGFDKILPFRYLSAAKAAPKMESEINQAMLQNMSKMEKLPGKTILIVDVSGSMYGGNISKYSEMDRAHAACSLAAVTRELCEDSAIYATAGNDGTRVHKTKLVPSRNGIPLADAIYGMSSPLGGGGIFLRQVMDYVHKEEQSADRVIVITDEQDCDTEDSVAKTKMFAKNHYLINVASYKNGIGYGPWVHIDGFSERVLDFIREYEAVDVRSNN